MTDLGPAEFDELFRLVHGYLPFAWQQRLAERALGGEWPEAVDVPTGLGKTAITDIAVFCLAAQAERPARQRTAPMRTFVVVDRRLIVDQAFLHAQRLQAALDPARPDLAGVVARRLLGLCAGTADRRPLEVVRMRGGTTWASGWLRSPAQPAVVCGTVDQVGSRLLFRGYGVGVHRRPIDAALVGTDRLLVLDEAHLSLPFLLSAQSVADEEAGAERPVLAARRPRPILLSATPPLGAAAPDDVFRADPTAELSAVARARLGAARVVLLVEVRGKDDAGFVEAVGRAATAQLAAGAKRVLVVLNTVALARGVHVQLVGSAPDADVALLIGRCRPIDRDRIAAEWLAPPDRDASPTPRADAGEVDAPTPNQAGRLSADRPRRAEDRAVIAVATQTVEVGADIDVDALITEACPLDSLLQRLGRLDRRGELGTSQAVVVHQEARHGDDAAVYRAAVPRTWAWLTAQAGNPIPATPGKLAAALVDAPTLDLGPAGIAALLTSGERSALAAEPPLAPVALGVQLAAWARTDPVPTPDQEVAPFLHGVDHGQPQIPVVWRAWASLGSDEARSADLAVAPLAGHETLTISIGDARRFLLRAEPATGSDLEGDDDDPLDPFEEGARLEAWYVDPAGEVTAATAGRLRPGSTLVLDVAAGGHDEWGWTGRAGDQLVVDVADLGSTSRGRAALRLRPAVLEPLLRTGTSTVCRMTEDERPDDLLERVRGAAGAAHWQAHEEGDLPRVHLLEELVRRCDALGGGDLRVRPLVDDSGRIDPYGGDGPVVLTAGRARQLAIADAGADGSTSTAAAPVGLDRHLRDVEARSREVGEALGLDSPLIQAIALAGLTHDLGKADRRFQAMLHQGSALRAEAWGEPIAKSGMDPADREAFRRARRHSGWPAGMRHEAISAALVDRLLQERPVPSDVDADLVRHLVVTHHGRGRPLLPPVTDAHPVEVEVALPGQAAPQVVRSDDLLIDWAGPSRFARLGCRYGWWGLALLEAVVRLADQAVSSEYDTERRPLAEESVGVDL